jgi:hypothetical protein
MKWTMDLLLSLSYKDVSYDPFMHVVEWKDVPSFAFVMT